MRKLEGDLLPPKIQLFLREVVKPKFSSSIPSPFILFLCMIRVSRKIWQHKLISSLALKKAFFNFNMACMKSNTYNVFAYWNSFQKKELYHQFLYFSHKYQNLNVKIHSKHYFLLDNVVFTHSSKLHPLKLSFHWTCYKFR